MQSIQAKLYLCFGLVVAATVASSAYSILATRSLRRQLTSEFVKSAATLDNARQVSAGIANMRSAMRGVSLFSMTHNPSQLAKARAGFEATSADVRSAVAQMESTELEDTDRATVNSIRSALDQWVQGWPQFSNLSAAGEGEQANAYALQNLTPVIDRLQQSAAELGRANRGRENGAAQSAEAAMGRSVAFNITFAVIVLLVGAGAFKVITGLVRNLKQIARSVAEGAREVSNAATHVADSSNSLARQSSEQAAALEQTSASTEQISATARKSTDNAETAAATVNQSSGKIADTNQVLDHMVQAMDDINTASGKISKIIKVIDEIAFQTNILALNAAVEAARAGEAGMGFAVVADEVRNLAQRCAQAAKETSSLIEDSVSKSNSGKATVDQVAQAIHSITADSRQVKNLVDEVSSGGREQVAGIEQVAKAIVQMERITQSVAAGAQQSAAAAQQLQAQSSTMTAAADELAALTGHTGRQDA